MSDDIRQVTFGFLISMMSSCVQTQSGTEHFRGKRDFHGVEEMNSLLGRSVPPLENFEHIHLLFVVGGLWHSAYSVKAFFI